MRRLGGGLALSVRDDPAHMRTKALGFGFAEPVTRELIVRITDFYREHRAPAAMIQLAPSVLPADWDEICAATGLSAGTKWAKLACETESAVAKAGPSLSGDLRLGTVAANQASEWTATMARVFGGPGGWWTAMMEAIAADPRWHPHAVWSGDQIVATAVVHVTGETAEFMFGATLPEYRRRGIQAALIAARARAARAAGCRWLVVETAAESPGEHNTSRANLRRAGFKLRYERTNWIWAPTGPTAG